MRFDKLQDWLQWQESCHPNEIELGLERVGNVAKAMAVSLSDCQVITVAGTNGKGSCVATLNALLLSAGYRVGCYTSPHWGGRTLAIATSPAVYQNAFKPLVDVSAWKECWIKYRAYLYGG